MVAELLNARGFRAITTRKARNLGNSDVNQLLYAVDHGMTLVTHNRVDFERLAQQYFRMGKKHHGIIISSRQPPQEIVRRLMRILNAVTADEMIGQVRYI